MRMLKPYIDFRGGWNADVAPDNLMDNELMLADNADLDERGAISKRKGTVPLNATSYAAQVERLIEWVRNDGTPILIAVIGNNLVKVSDADGSTVSLLVLDNPSIGHFAFQDKFWFTCRSAGVDYYKVYDGTTVANVTPNAATDNDLTPIKRCRLFVRHPKSMRFFATLDPSDPAAVYYSEPNDPTYFKATSKLYPGGGEGPVTGLATFGEAVLVFYRNGVWMWKGVDPATDTQWGKIPVSHGTVSPGAIVLAPSVLTFLSGGGIYALTPVLLEPNVALLTEESVAKNLARNKVSSVLRSITNPNIAKAVYIDSVGKYLLAYCDVAGGTRNNNILVLDWPLMAFTRYTGIQVNDFCLRSNGDLLVASNNYILKMFQGYKDWDVAAGAYKGIDFHVKTKAWPLDRLNERKKVYRVFLSTRQYGAETSTIDLTVTADYASQTFTNISLDESFVWGEPWGNVWGWEDYTIKEAYCMVKGQRVQAEFTNNRLDEPVTVYGIAFEYKLLRPRGVKIN